ncbi:hypothetical protein ELUMI_v1c06650 [Williamsoniiplasma luminosum]|uniref:Lipoprotein n=1 Tax=Williamsoniiplasma luminosum TaxID=214888 RepID=A0A2K8NUE6_9MOLU|nr:lipoprotein [Williamsoniiplasma luminosum]ATZ17387.1 hypothetical protein ELUMI_v1c06650 [Williamsoniiplasma luminosum]
MKKLLTLLSTVSLITTISATVISCGSGIKNPNTGEKPKPDQGKDEINALIKNFENEVTSKWIQQVASPMSNKANLVDSETNNIDINFFSRENLERIYNKASQSPSSIINLEPRSDNPTNGGHKTFYEKHLDGVEQQRFVKSVETILSPIKMMSEMKKSIRQQMYQVLIGSLGNAWIEDIKFDYKNAKLNFTTLDGEETKNKFLANIELDYSAKYSYLDYENQKVNKELKTRVSITISDDGVIIETIKKVQKSLAADLMKDGSDLVWIDKNSLNGASAEDIVGGKTKKYETALNSYYTKNLIQNLQKEIKTKYFDKSNNSILKSTHISLKDSNDVIRSLSNTSQIGSLKLKDVKLTTLQGSEAGIIDAKEIERQKLYLGTTTTITSDPLYEDLKTAFKTQKNAYLDKFDQEYDEVIKHASIETENSNNFHIKPTIANHELVTFKGIQFHLSNGYSQNLNDINIDIAVSVDKKSTHENDVNGQIFKAYHNGAKKSLDVFHRFYGIKPTDIDELNSTSIMGQKGLLFYMTGKPLDEKGQEIDKNFNIWNYWKNLPSDKTFIKDKPNSKLITDGLNLNIDDGNGTVKKMKEEHFISQLVGTSTFSLDYSQKSSNNNDNERSFWLAERDKLEPGLRVKSSQDVSWTTLQLELKNDLFKIKFGDFETGKFDDSKFDFTLIAKK